MCWHKWEIKKRVSRVFFSKIDVDSGYLCCLAVSAILVSLLIAFTERPITANDLGMGVLITSYFSVLLLMFGVPLWLILDGSTEQLDRVCLKCHHVSLAASRYEKDVLESYKKKRKQQEVAKGQSKKTADAVFENRKEMWKKAS